jgi:hypothetical protein
MMLAGAHCPVEAGHHKPTGMSGLNRGEPHPIAVVAFAAAPSRRAPARFGLPPLSSSRRPAVVASAGYGSYATFFTLRVGSAQDPPILEGQVGSHGNTIVGVDSFGLTRLVSGLESLVHKRFHSSDRGQTCSRTRATMLREPA